MQIDVNECGCEREEIASAYRRLKWPAVVFFYADTPIHSPRTRFTLIDVILRNTLSWRSVDVSARFPDQWAGLRFHTSDL